MKRNTTEEFIAKSIIVHGDKYNYSQVNYMTSKIKVSIICPKHGIFQQTPCNHLAGKECMCCSKEKISIKYSLGKDEFVKRAIEIHGQKYDYSKVNYINGRKKVILICPKHGEFLQSPEVHILQKGGCKQCADELNSNAKRFTKDEFIKRANEIHYCQYDYSLVEYNNIDTEVKITCPIHGVFAQKPYVHLNLKGGCPRCAIEKNSSKQRLGLDEFQLRANKIHGNKYDYSLIESYKNMNQKIPIICSIHRKVFYQTFASHLQGNGCPRCVGRHKTTQDFIEEARLVHGDKYDYDIAVYKGASQKIKIICPKHGTFKQMAIGHLSGKGCPKCSFSHMENRIMRALEKRNIKYESQKTFNWLLFKRKQYLDFYLPDYNIAIECQGIQHFMPTKQTGGDKAFQVRCKMDKNKYDLCKKHNIDILYYSPKTNYLPTIYIDVMYNSIKVLMSKIRQKMKEK